MHYVGKWAIRRCRFSHIHSQSPVCCLTACTPVSLSPLPPSRWEGGFGGAWQGSLALIEHPPSLISSSRAQPSIFLARRYASHWRFYGNDALVLPVSAFSRASFIGLPEGFLDFARNDDTQKTASPHSSPFLWKGLPSAARRGWHLRLLKYVFPYFASAPWMP